MKYRKHWTDETLPLVLRTLFGRNSLHRFSPISFRFSRSFTQHEKKKLFFFSLETDLRAKQNHSQRCADIFFPCFFRSVFTYLHLWIAKLTSNSIHHVQMICYCSTSTAVHFTVELANVFPELYLDSENLLRPQVSRKKKYILFSAFFTRYRHAIRLIAINRQFYVIYFVLPYFLIFCPLNIRFVVRWQSVFSFLLASLSLSVPLCLSRNSKCKSIVIFVLQKFFKILSISFLMPFHTYGPSMNRKRTSFEARDRTYAEREKNILIIFLCVSTKQRTVEAVRNRPRSAREKNNETSESCYVLLYTENYQISRRVPFYMCHVISSPSSSLCTHSAL